MHHHDVLQPGEWLRLHLSLRAVMGTCRRPLPLLLLTTMCAIDAIGALQTMVVTDQVFVGHLGVTELAAAALGNTYFNLMWFFLLGCSTALDTLGSQAYGANDYSSLLTWTYAGFIVLSVLCCFMAAGLWYAREVALYLFFQPEEVAAQVSVFCRWLIPGMWPMVAHDHEADIGHIDGEPDDWTDFLLPYKHESLAGQHPHEGEGASLLPGADGGEGGADAFAEALASSASKNPFGSPRFASPRFRGA
ncbi:putative transporter C11D3.06 [Tetrabaena socialis]|uniref:Putative transporter C11D3.06 n=1 Tax=Tetrabaena socialis TaxID=47790 RepID=A0A2J7ZXC6_9CHLO|nr:putative transporter C11D3.06 [Tetrabaena socialis]|eukprot:PNH04931.1 putative transporter C11D3.06 [Tetrabaena socialis]